MKNSVNFFKEWVAGNSLDEIDRAKYFLICRYRNKASKRLLNKLPLLIEKGKEAFDQKVRDMLNKPNPFIPLGVPGSAYVVPVKFKP